MTFKKSPDLLTLLLLLIGPGLFTTHPAQAQREPKKATEIIEECLVEQGGREFCQVISKQQVNADAQALGTENTQYITRAEAEQKQRNAEYQQMSEELERGNQQQELERINANAQDK